MINTDPIIDAKDLTFSLDRITRCLLLPQHPIPTREFERELAMGNEEYNVIYGRGTKDEKMTKILGQTLFYPVSNSIRGMTFDDEKPRTYHSQAKSEQPERSQLGICSAQLGMDG